jgi:hypothetical protein
MNKNSQKKVARRSFSGAMSATAERTGPGNRRSHCFPGQCRPFPETNDLGYSLVRSNVGQSDVKSHNFAFNECANIKSKDIWQVSSLT